LCFCGGPEGPKRIAVLRFENLSPDPATDWIGRAISQEVAGQLEGSRHQAIIPFAVIRRFDNTLGPRPVSAPGISTEQGAAIASGANRTLGGYYVIRNDRLTITAKLWNLETNHGGEPLVVSGGEEDLLHLCDLIAGRLDDEARPPITGSARALRSYALALEIPPEEAGNLLEEAVRLDPDFGPAWSALARLDLAKHDNEAFDRIFREARSRAGGIRAIDRAILNLEDARMHASATAQTDALAALVKLTPADPFRLRELADSELNSGRFAEAADSFRKLALLLPTDPEIFNDLGYALMYAGDDLGATSAFEKYRKARPQDANPLDSIGDCNFFFGRFDKAESLYVEAYAKDPTLIEGCELLKAAWASLMRNDRGKAGAQLREYRDARQKAADPLADYRAAEFLRVLGRHDEADRLLTPFANLRESAPGLAAVQQLAWWRFLENAGPAPGKTSLLNQALAAYQKQDFQAAYPLWRKLAEGSSANDWWVRPVYARVLLKTGQTQESARYLRFTPLPQPTRAVSFDELWYPWILQARSQASGKAE